MRLFHLIMKYIFHIASLSTIGMLITFYVVVSNNPQRAIYQTANNSPEIVNDEQGDSRSLMSSASVADDISETLQHYNINNSIPTNQDILEPFDNTKRNQMDIDLTPALTSTNGSTTINVDRNIVMVAEGDTAVNSGRIEEFDPSRMQIKPSAGMIELLPDGSWIWTYPTNSNAPENLTVVMTVTENGGVIASQSFLMTTANSEVVDMPPDKAIRMDQDFLEVEHGKLAVNTGKIDGLESQVVKGTTSLGSLEFMPDGSWLWMYPTRYEATETDAKSVFIDIETTDGLVFQTSFTIEITNFSIGNVVIAPVFNQNITINQYFLTPTHMPTQVPPTEVPPTSEPTDIPTLVPTEVPPTSEPTDIPTLVPTDVPPTSEPTDIPTLVPTEVPPTSEPTDISPQIITNTPTDVPTNTATDVPTQVPPTNTATDVPTQVPPTNTATDVPTQVPPTNTPTDVPTQVPPTNTATDVPTQVPPTNTPTDVPTQVPPPTNTPFVPADGAHFVSRNGNNQNGQSWATAWTELNQINWSAVQPGDVIYIDGGTDGMTYERELSIRKSGTANQPIYIQASAESGHNGQVIFFGGRDIPLPYCGQSSYNTSNEGSIRSYGIRTNNHQNIVIDGLDWRGIVIHGYKRNGLRIDSYSNNITLRNVEIYNNGYPRQTSNGWSSDDPGIRMGGTNITIQRSIVHDNGQDAIQGAWEPHDVVNLRVEQSWLYNGRKNPTRPNEAWNHCTHTDGIQIYSGDVFKGITITESVIGPGFMQNLILGGRLTSYGEWAHVQDVLIEDVLLMKALGNNIYGYHDTNSRNWTINRVTVHCPSTGGQCLHLENSDHSITDSIISGGRIVLPDGLDHYDGNCTWDIISSNFNLGETHNPNFVDVSNSDRFSLDDYTVQNPNCVGSRITSVQQLLSGDFGGTTPQTIPPTEVPTDVPTEEPTSIPTDVPTQVPTHVPTMVPTSAPTDIPAPPVNGVYYVSKNGNNQNGQSWTTAWSELNQINWNVIQPGDVIYIDGGSSEMTYQSELYIGQSGTSGQPIRIQSSTESGHNGQVVFFGGRDALLPYCGQPNFDNSNASQLRRIGVHTQGHDNIVIDGMDWNGIVMHGFGVSGMDISHNSTNITVRNVEIYNNGVARRDGGGWSSDQPGVRLAGTNVLFQRAIIHDNGQDAFQGSNEPQNLSNFRLEESWLYNGRKNPNRPNEAWNHCTHSDGIQIYAGGVISGITVKDSVMGPGFLQNLIMGQTVSVHNEWADVQDVTLEDVLLMKATANNIYGFSYTDTQNWNLNRVTVHCVSSRGQCMQIFNSNHSVTNSIFRGGLIYLPDGLDHYEGNCLSNMIWSTVPLGENINPDFVDVSDTDYFSLDDYTVQNPACIGSRVTSVQSLLSGAYKNNPIVNNVARTTASVNEAQAETALIEPTATTALVPFSLTVDNTQVTTSEGTPVVNTGQIVDATSTIESLTTSQGTVALLTDGGWEWTFTPEDGPAPNQTITIDAVDADGVTSQATFILKVENVPPTGEFSYAVVDTINPSISLTFSNIKDVSLVDNAEGFTFQYDCDGDGTFEMIGILSTVVCEVATLDQVNTVARVLDKDDGFTDYLVDTATLASTIILPQVTATLPAVVPSPTAIGIPTDIPAIEPTMIPTDVPAVEPTMMPTDIPAVEPTIVPTDVPTLVPTTVPTDVPTLVPTTVPTDVPPTMEPTVVPTTEPPLEPTAIPVDDSTNETVEESEPEPEAETESEQA